MQSEQLVVSRKMEFLRQKLLNRKQQLKHWLAKTERFSELNLALKYIFLYSFDRQKLIKLRITCQANNSQSHSPSLSSHSSYNLQQKSNPIIEDSDFSDKFPSRSPDSNIETSQTSQRSYFPQFPKIFSPIPINRTNTKSHFLFEDEDPMFSSFLDQNIDPNNIQISQNLYKPLSKLMQSKVLKQELLTNNIAEKNLTLRKGAFQRQNEHTSLSNSQSFVRSVSPVKVVKEIYCQNCRCYLKPFQFFTHSHQQ